MALNSAYSYYWDLEMDWDMPWLVQPGKIEVEIEMCGHWHELSSARGVQRVVGGMGPCERLGWA
jgi:hypothetical protein